MFWHISHDILYDLLQDLPIDFFITQCDVLTCSLMILYFSQGTNCIQDLFQIVLACFFQDHIKRIHLEYLYTIGLLEYLSSCMNQSLFAIFFFCVYSAMPKNHVIDVLNLLFLLVMHYIELNHVHPSSYHLKEASSMRINEYMHVNAFIHSLQYSAI